MKFSCRRAHELATKSMRFISQGGQALIHVPICTGVFLDQGLGGLNQLPVCRSQFWHFALSKTSAVRTVLPVWSKAQVMSSRLVDVHL